jgi:hypothetical protein
MAKRAKKGLGRILDTPSSLVVATHMSSNNAERPSIRGLGEIRSGYGVTLDPTKTRDRPWLLQPTAWAFSSLQLASRGFKSITQPCRQL